MHKIDIDTVGFDLGFREIVEHQGRFLQTLF